MRLSTIPRLLLVGIAAATFFPETAAAQEVSDAPKVVLGGLPFTLEVTGGTDDSLWYEVRNAGNTLLGSGTVAAGATASVADLVVAGRDELPLSVLIGDTTHQVRPPFAPGWFS